MTSLYFGPFGFYRDSGLTMAFLHLPFGRAIAVALRKSAMPRVRLVLWNTEEDS